VAGIATRLERRAAIYRADEIIVALVIGWEDDARTRPGLTLGVDG
jgi:hypothetical protein